MGYRHYFYEIKKNLASEISSCKNEKELCTLFRANGVEADEDYCPLYHIGKSVFEFGKYYEAAEDVMKTGKPLFTSKELLDRYDEYGATVCGKESVAAAINWQKNHVAEMYQNLLSEQAPHEYDTRTQLERLMEHCRDYLHWWKNGYSDTPCDMNFKSPNVSNSWLYEHTIFDLVRIYKQTDWENKCLLFMGW